jgi:hypothetical protein
VILWIKKTFPSPFYLKFAVYVKRRFFNLQHKAPLTYNKSAQPAFDGLLSSIVMEIRSDGSLSRGATQPARHRKPLRQGGRAIGP